MDSWLILATTSWVIQKFKKSQETAIRFKLLKLELPPVFKELLVYLAK